MVFRRLVQPIVSLSINAWHVISRSGSSQFILTVEKEGRARQTKHQKTIHFILQKIHGVKTMIRFDRVIPDKRLPLPTELSELFDDFAEQFGELVGSDSFGLYSPVSEKSQEEARNTLAGNTALLTLLREADLA